jgi:threonylcarbamoyladenosine tRNA methylthiotransferase MtaB
MTPHLHLCLQSGSEKTLLKMRRQYSYAQYLDIVRRIRRDLPEFNITTDIIVGFPGEGESEFNESLEALRTIGFGHVHAFKYSVRKGTRAERMDGKVDEKTKSARSESLRIAAEAEKNRYRRGFIGRNQRVLVERTLESGGKIWARALGSIISRLPSPCREAGMQPHS